MLSAALIVGSVSLITNADGTREVLVTNTEELHAALADAQAGDEIILKEGVYTHSDWIGVWAFFYAEASGTAEKPIILRSEDPEKPATISGNTYETKTALRIIGSYWKIRDLNICNAAKGIFLEQSEHTVISNCEVYDIGDEAIHIIDNSSYIYEDLTYQLPEKQAIVLKAIAREDKVEMLQSGQFIRKHNLNSASSVMSAVKGLMEKGLVTNDRGTYYVYDYFLKLWIQRQK